jgi:hypothetical protein
MTFRLRFKTPEFHAQNGYYQKTVQGAADIFGKFLEPPLGIQMMTQIVLFPDYLFICVCRHISKKIRSIAPGIELQEQDKVRMVKMICAGSIIK